MLLNYINIWIVPSALTFLYVAMKKLTVEINFMKSDIQALRNCIEHSMLVKNNQISTIAFLEKYNFIKIQSAEEFKQFDSELQTNDEFAKDFVSICFAIALAFLLIYKYNFFAERCIKTFDRLKYEAIYYRCNEKILTS